MIKQEEKEILINQQILKLKILLNFNLIGYKFILVIIVTYL